MHPVDMLRQLLTRQHLLLFEYRCALIDISNSIVIIATHRKLYFDILIVPRLTRLRHGLTKCLALRIHWRLRLESVCRLVLRLEVLLVEDEIDH